MANEEIIKLAKETMHKFDTIIDLFDMCFVYISEESAKLSGYTSDEMIGKHISNFMAIDSKSQDFRKVIMNSMRGKAIVPIKTKSGKIIEIPMDFITIKVKGEPFLVTRAVK